MPKKIRELKGLLAKAGFTWRPGKGSHTVWSHPKVRKSIVLAGNDGRDAQPYQEKEVQRRIRESRKSR
jgi:predicted RNA binding protein YcfA (HicA-like mRNA interferase family)